MICLCRHAGNIPFKFFSSLDLQLIAIEGLSSHFGNISLYKQLKVQNVLFLLAWKGR